VIDEALLSVIRWYHHHETSIIYEIVSVDHLLCIVEQLLISALYTIQSKTYITPESRLSVIDCGVYR